MMFLWYNNYKKKLYFTFYHSLDKVTGALGLKGTTLFTFNEHLQLKLIFIFQFD